jgi:hypothetical protein
MDQLETSVAFLRIDKDGILHIRMKKGVHLTLENLIEYYKATDRLLKGKKALVLLDASEEFEVSPEARTYMNSDEANRNRIALAYVTSSIANQLLFNIVNSISPKKLPRRMFSDQKKALRWLKSFYILPGEKFVKKK